MTLRPVRPLFLALLLITTTAASVCAAEPDPAVLSYKLPADFKWSESAAYPGLKNTALWRPGQARSLCRSQPVFARYLFATALSPERPLHRGSCGHLVGGNR